MIAPPLTGSAEPLLRKSTKMPAETADQLSRKTIPPSQPPETAEPHHDESRIARHLRSPPTHNTRKGPGQSVCGPVGYREEVKRPPVIESQASQEGQSSQLQEFRAQKKEDHDGGSFESQPGRCCAARPVLHHPHGHEARIAACQSPPATAFPGRPLENVVSDTGIMARAAQSTRPAGPRLWLIGPR